MSQSRSFSARSRGVASGLAVLTALGASAAGTAAAQPGDVTAGGSVQAAALSAAKAGGNHISVKVSSHQKVGKKFSYSISGSRTGKANHLASVLDTKACAATLKAEDSRFSKSQLQQVRFIFTKLPQAFKASGRIKPRSTGKHFICAYLFNSKSKKTFAAASGSYTTSK